MRGEGFDPNEVLEEQRRMRRLRIMVDLTAAVIRHRPLTLEEAQVVIEHLRAKVLELFPDKADVFDLIYRPRFRRLVEERFGKREETAR